MKERQTGTAGGNQRLEAYWRENTRFIFILATIWFFASLVHPLFARQLNNITILTGFPLGYWLASQGSITLFVILIFVYAYRMNKLDEKYGFDEREE
jgi:putative solute:sodium symporter small subunit